MSCHRPIRDGTRQNTSKITIPGRKRAYRLVGTDGVPILDIMLLGGEDPPRPGVPILARRDVYMVVLGSGHEVS